MRKIIYFICTLFAAVFVFASCTDAPVADIPITDTPIDQGQLQSTAISTNNVQYCGWQDYISDGTYVIASEGFQTGAITKYNLTTGNITNVCLKSGCRHSFASFEHTMSENCPIPPNSTLFFIHNQKIYFKYEVSHFDEQELEEFESTKLLKRSVFASYDLTTGERQNILSS